MTPASRLSEITPTTRCSADSRTWISSRVTSPQRYGNAPSTGLPARKASMNTNTDAFRSSASEWPEGSLQRAVPVTERDHVIGDPDAPVTVVQYGDYECAQCLNAEPIVKGLLRLHGRQMRFVFRHFPQYSLHPQASLAAQAAEAAGAQGKFWEMHDLLFR